MNGIAAHGSITQFVSLLEQAQAIAVDKILNADSSSPWEEMDHLISECLANFPLDVGQRVRTESALV